METDTKMRGVEIPGSVEKDQNMERVNRCLDRISREVFRREYEMDWKVKPPKNYLVVLDFSQGRTVIYSLLGPTRQEAESILRVKGHKEKDCQWMMTSEVVLK